MIEPKRVLRALAEHWALIEPLCERFDQGTLSLVELRQQLARQQVESTPQDITQLLDVWIRLDIRCRWPRARTASSSTPRSTTSSPTCAASTAWACALRSRPTCATGAPGRAHPDAFDNRDSDDLARQLRLLDMRVRDVLKKLDNDEQALVAVAERAKTSNRQIPCANVTPKSWRLGTNTSSR